MGSSNQPEVKKAAEFHSGPAGSSTRFLACRNDSDCAEVKWCNRKRVGVFWHCFADPHGGGDAGSPKSYLRCMLVPSALRSRQSCAVCCLARVGW